MKMNMLKAAMAVALLAVGVNAYAVTATTSFSGTMGNACSLSATSNGVMKPTSDKTGIDSGQAGATKGSVTVNCNTTGTISVGMPVGVGSAATAVIGNDVNRGSEIQKAGSIVALNYRDIAATTGTVSSGVYDVHAWIHDTAVLPAGDYSLTVTTTLTAN